MSGAVRASDGRKGARVSTPKGKRKAAPAASVGLCDGPNPETSIGTGNRGRTVLRARSDDPAAKTLDFIRSLRVPEGPLHGQQFQLAPFQEQFIRGVLDPDVMTAMLSVGRGQGKSMLSAALALAHLMGVSDDQPRRQVIIAARVKEQARIAWEYVQAIVLQLPEDEQALFTFRQAPRLEISVDRRAIRTPLPG